MICVDLAGKVLAVWGLARVLAKFSTKNYHPKLPNLGSP